MGATVMQSFNWPLAQDGPTFQVQQCSGVLVAPRVFLTAAHCTAFLSQAQTFRQIGVTFEQVTPFGPFDPDDDGLLHGTVVQDPEFPLLCPITTCQTADPHDIAAVILDEDAPGEPAALPPAGVLDELARHNGLKGSTFSVAGYGGVGDEPGGGRPPANVGRGTRRIATASYMALSPAVLRMRDTGMVVGLTITGDLDTGCMATNVAYRLDTSAARAFLASPQIAQHLALP